MACDCPQPTFNTLINLGITEDNAEYDFPSISSDQIIKYALVRLSTPDFAGKRLSISTPEYERYFDAGFFRIGFTLANSDWWLPEFALEAGHNLYPIIEGASKIQVWVPTGFAANCKVAVYDCPPTT